MARKSYADEASEELREIMRHAGALLDATAEEGDERIKKARERLEERMEAARSKIDGLDDLIGEKVEAADRLVREKPYHAIGGSFLLGLLLGWFMSRK